MNWYHREPTLRGSRSPSHSDGANFSSAAHNAVRGLAVVALVVVWSVSHVPTST